MWSPFLLHCKQEAQESKLLSLFYLDTSLAHRLGSTKKNIQTLCMGYSFFLLRKNILFSTNPTQAPAQWERVGQGVLFFQS